MSNVNVPRWTGAFGVASGVLILVTFVLYFAAGTAPRPEEAARFSDYVTRNNGLFLTLALVDALSVACFLVFLAGFRGLIRQAKADYEWASALVFGAGLVIAALTLVFDTLIGGAALDTVSKPEPAVVRGLFEGGILLIGSSGLVTTALFLGSAGYVILGTGALPRWTGWVSYAGAILNLAAAPSIYGGSDPAGFYTAAGYAPLFMGVIPYVIWLLIAGTSIVMRREAAAPIPPQQR